MTSNIIEASNLPQEEKVYLKKDILGWRVVEPIINPETKKINWSGVFNKKGMVSLIFILVIIGLLYFGFQEQIKNYKEVMNNPCKYCKDCQQQTKEYINKYGSYYNIPINFSLGMKDGDQDDF